MGQYLAEVLIHVNESLDASGVAELEEKLCAQNGVVLARHRDGFNQVLQVMFDPDATRASQLLTPVAAHGFHAQLIGM
jgi:hypothetical protein